MTHDVRTIYVKFSFSNFARVPLGLQQDPDETHVEAYLRKQLRDEQESAELLFPITTRIDIHKFLDDLTNGNYIPVRCSWQQRLKDGTRYPAVRLLLVHRAYLRPNQRVLPVVTILRELTELTRDNLWRIRAYVNTRRDLEEQGLEVGCSFNFEACEPLCDRHGNQRLERIDQSRDENGRKIGALVPIQPNAALRLIDRRFALLST